MRTFLIMYTCFELYICCFKCYTMVLKIKPTIICCVYSRNVDTSQADITDSHSPMQTVRRCSVLYIKGDARAYARMSVSEYTSVNRINLLNLLRVTYYIDCTTFVDAHIHSFSIIIMAE